MRTERCVCGGYITAPDGDWDAIAGAVLLHGRSEQHGAWRLGITTTRATEPADWHYDGGRDIGTRVPYALTPSRTPVHRVDIEGTTAGSGADGRDEAHMGLDAAQSYPHRASHGGKHSWNSAFHHAKRPPMMVALSKAQPNTGGLV